VSVLENNVNKFGSAMILAGGKSSRMGFDKQFLKLENKSNIESLIEKLSPIFDEFIIVTNKQDLYDKENLKIVSDEIKDKGPLSGIYIGLKTARSKYVYCIACDMPIVNLGYIKHMMEILDRESNLAIVTRALVGIEPFNAFYSKDLVDDIERHLMEEKRDVKSLLEKVKTSYISYRKALSFSPDWSMFLNLNTREDLEVYESFRSR